MLCDSAVAKYTIVVDYDWTKVAGIVCSVEECDTWDSNNSLKQESESCWIENLSA
jgi:hypothetical protein